MFLPAHHVDTRSSGSKETFQGVGGPQFYARYRQGLSEFFYSPTDARVNCLKNNFKVYIKIDMETAPTYFGAVTPSSGSALLVFAKVTVVKIAN
jgi:hypothetical protein